MNEQERQEMDQLISEAKKAVYDLKKRGDRAEMIGGVISAAGFCTLLVGTILVVNKLDRSMK